VVVLRGVVCLALGVVLTPGVQACGQVLASPQTSAVVSPDVGSDRRVTFRLIAPAAASAAVTGLASSPSQAAKEGRILPMRRDGDVWIATSEPLAPDIYSYQFTVDGRPLNDPANSRFIEEFAGERTSAFAVPGALWTTRAARAGSVARHSYRSAAVGGDEEYYVYTPPGYQGGGTASYPALYLLHGMGDNAHTWVTNGGVNVTLDNLIAQGRATPMVVVMPLGYGGSDLFAFEPFDRALVEEIIPQVEQAYRVSPSRDARAVAGVSMGGSHAMSVALRHPDLFGWVGSFSGAFQMGAAAQLAGLRAPIVRGQFALIYAGWGAADTLATVNRQFAADLRSRGATVTTDEVPGLGHVWPLWRRLAGEFLERVFQVATRAAMESPTVRSP
jgi:enterochelin esterase family protein